MRDQEGIDGLFLLFVFASYCCIIVVLIQVLTKKRLKQFKGSFLPQVLARMKEVNKIFSFKYKYYELLVGHCQFFFNLTENRDDSGIHLKISS